MAEWHRVRCGPARLLSWALIAGLDCSGPDSMPWYRDCLKSKQFHVENHYQWMNRITMDRDDVYRVSRDPTEEHRGADEEAETSSLHIWNPAETSTHQPCFNKHWKSTTFIINRAKSNGGSCARVLPGWRKRNSSAVTWTTTSFYPPYVPQR